MIHKLSVGQVQKSFSNASKEIEKQEAKPEKAQLKEHCSAKAAKAIRCAALGLMLAASVGGAVLTSNKSSQSQEPEVTISQEVSDVSEIQEDKAADTDSINIEIYSAWCTGDMRYDSRQYDDAKIYEDGVLEFYSKDTSYDYNIWKNETERVVTKTVRGQFDLQTKCEEGHYDMPLQTGVKFYEIGDGRGDYLVADENGVLTVYDCDDNVVGNVELHIYDENENPQENVAVLAGMVMGGLAGGVGADLLFRVADKIENDDKKNT